MARPSVPKFGDWGAAGNSYPYTVCFDNARKGRAGGKVQNPNDPEENPDLYSHGPPPTQSPEPRARPQREEPKRVAPGARTAEEHKPRPDDRDYRRATANPPGKNDNVGNRTHGSKLQGVGGTYGEPNYGELRRRTVNKENPAAAERGVAESPVHVKSSGRGAASPSWEGKGTYDGGHGNSGRSRMRGSTPGNEQHGRGAGVALPKFGEWDVKNTCGDGYTQVFNRVREEKRTPGRSPLHVNAEQSPSTRGAKKPAGGHESMGGCCFPWGKK